MSESAFSNSFAGADIFPLRAAPTVSRTQWTNVALRKLSEGYALVQDPSGKRFSFYQPGRPTQACPAHAAKKLIAMGLLTIARTNARGTHFVLLDETAPTQSLAVTPVDLDDELSEINLPDGAYEEMDQEEEEEDA